MAGANWSHMNFKHAVGFLFLGTVFGLMPRIAPGWSHVTSVDSLSTRELWLQVMSFVQIGLAGVYFFGRVCAYFASVMEFTTASGLRDRHPDFAGDYAVPSEEFAVVPMRRPVVAPRLRPAAILPIPVAFKSGLIEQRRAA